MMDKDKIADEYQKCIDSPYYFATTYIAVQNNEGIVKFTTLLSEKEFNALFKKYHE